MIASRATSTPQTEQPDPLNDKGLGCTSPKTTNSPELGLESPSKGPNEGP
jgi:hypothetical protein